MLSTDRALELTYDDPRAKHVAQEIAHAYFEGRTGHGGGPCTYRQLRPAELEAALLFAIALYNHRGPEGSNG